MDFVTDLTVSKGYNTIWVVVDRFSFAAYFILLMNLPTSAQLAHLFIKEIFRLHGHPSEIVSDRGTQFNLSWSKGQFGPEMCLTFLSLYVKLFKMTE